ncbi:MAG: hypothetical protein WCC86_04200 [Methanoregula sp.]|uniref:hypothetical protein n=1 Tax=Methanoregula sp. TaxID=2052170 RepID=UPI003BB19C57
MQYLTDRGWIVSHKSKQDTKGRPLKIYALAIPITDIMDSIEKEIETKANNQLKLIRKLRGYPD